MKVIFTRNDIIENAQLLRVFRDREERLSSGGKGERYETDRVHDFPKTSKLIVVRGVAL